MQPIPLVRASSILPLFGFIESGGGGLRALRERVEPVFRRPGALLPVAYGGGLFEEAARASGLGDLGLRLGRTVAIDGFGAWGPLIDRSATAGAFLQAALASYRSFNTGYRLWTVARGDEFWLHLGYGRSLQSGRAQAIDYSLLLWLAALRRLLGPSWQPTEIHLEGDPPGHARELEALATRRVVYRQPSLAIGFPRRLLAHRDGGSRTVARTAARDTTPASGFTDSVRQTVASLLQLGVTELAVTAEAAGMSERSFQRRLGAAGLTFSELLDGARFEAARRMLADPAVKVIDVAIELGYSDPANFTRAFRRWSGVAPQPFRRAGWEALPAAGAR